jgi:subtilase family serine protease
MKSALIRSSLLALLSTPLLGAAQPYEGAPSSTTQIVATNVTPLPVLSRATDIGPASGTHALTVAVSLPYAHPEEMQTFVDSVSNPQSPSYRHFISPEQIGERFGIPSSQVDDLANYLRENGFEVTLVAKTRLSVIANGTVAQAERAFHTTIREYTIVPQNEFEPSQFIAPSATLRLPTNLASIVIDVSGLDTYTLPQKRTSLLTPPLTRGLYDTIGKYNGGDTGAGRVACVSNFDGYRKANWLLYISHFGLPVPAAGPGSNIITVLVSGGGSGAGTPGGEGDIDIQQELGMAPLASIHIYDSPPGGNLIAVLSQESSDNECDQVSESYGWNLPTTTLTSAHNQHVAMSAEGITYMAASGDNGTSIEPYSYPDMEPEVLQVGGTVANVDNTTGARISEVGWSGGGGGWSTNPIAFNVRPSWQVGNGVPAVNANNNHRLLPDVSFHSAGSPGAYEFYYNSTLTSNFWGTSFASPMFAGSLCVIEQQVIMLGGLTPDAFGHRRFGRIQDLIYSENGDPTIWFDIVSGSNGQLPSGQGASTAHAGWDTVGGWGPMDCGAFAPVAACATGAPCGGSMTPFCFGDGADPFVTTNCPCLNFGATGHGCANAVNASGAQLTATGTTSPDTVVLTSAGELNSSLSVFLQGNANTNSGILFGDGVRCAAGNLKRLYTLNASGGTVSAPGPTDPSITAQSAALGDPIIPGTSRYYQVYYRDPNLAFCTGLGFNVSNGMRIDW